MWIKGVRLSIAEYVDMLGLMRRRTVIESYGRTIQNGYNLQTSNRDCRRSFVLCNQASINYDAEL